MTTGLTWQEMAVDRAFRSGRRTVREADFAQFVTVTAMTEPLFLDDTLTRDQHGGRRFIPGALTFSLAEGLIVQSGILHGTGLALLEVTLTVAAPTYVGDTLWVESTVTASRPTAKGPDRGIVTTRNAVVVEGREEPVMTYQAVRMVAGRRPGPDAGAPAPSHPPTDPPVPHPPEGP